VIFVKVDETFTMMWHQSDPRSGSRSADDLSPLSGLFLYYQSFLLSQCCNSTVGLFYVTLLEHYWWM